MPGIKDYTKPSAVHMPAWAIYRSAVAADDDPAHPELAPRYDLSDLPSGPGGIIHLTMQRVAGAGTCQVRVFSEGFGSLAAVRPFNLEASLSGVSDGAELMFRRLPAVPHRILLTDIEPGASWTVHITKTCVPIA